MCVRLHYCTAAAAPTVPWHDPGVPALGIHHVGIAVRDLEGARARYEQLYGARIEARERVRGAGGGGPRAAGRGRAGASSCWRRSSEDTPVGRFLARRGEGMHHLAFGVADLRAELALLRAAGATLIDEEPRTGIYGEVAFVHHESLGGVLSELVQSTTEREA